MHGLTADDRREAKIQQAQANEQITLLERGSDSGSLGFLHLPLSRDRRLPAWLQLPATAALCLRAGGSGKGSAAFLQRARFLAIAEFGPRSLIYHEGRAYRVYKAKLPPTSATTTAGS